ncbi:hydrolase [Alteromonadaceae bacterium BrNp21-10]|nr:hydrolase [Alteromonadaceae bacterium BrNp21-10]
MVAVSDSHYGKIITSQFIPAWWAKNRHMQTVWPRYLQKRKQVDLTWQRLELPDGDFVDLSWTPKPQKSKGIAVLFHGLEGSAKSHYARDMLAVMAQRGWHAVMMHFRGCSNEANRLHRAYHSGDTGDALYCINWLEKQFPSINKVAVGFSLGANMLLKLLGENPTQKILKAAVCVSPPFRLEDCAAAINHGFSNNYQKYLLRSMVRKLTAKMAILDYSQYLDISLDSLKKLTTFREFDEYVTAPLHQFNGAQDYYDKCSAIGFTQKVNIPTLVLHAKDDPFMTPEIIPPAQQLSPAITIELSEHGGHVGFMQGTPWHPKVWLHQRVPQFFDEQLGFD